MRRLRILELVARLERGRAIRVDDVAAALNAAYLDWTFAPVVVADALVALQANWLSDYRNASGIVLVDGRTGLTVTIEDSSRVDPWIVRQALRSADACREALLAFSRRVGPASMTRPKTRPAVLCPGRTDPERSSSADPRR